MASTNPIALFFAFVALVAVSKILLGKIGIFKKNSSYVGPVLVAIAIIAIIYIPILKVISLSLPLLALVFLFLVGVGCLFYVLGMKQGTIAGNMKSIGMIRITTYILIAVAIMFGFSQLWGNQLLEDQTVSFADNFAPAQEKVGVDFAPLFTKQALGLIMIMIIIGMIFAFVNVSGG